MFHLRNECNPAILSSTQERSDSKFCVVLMVQFARSGVFKVPNHGSRLLVNGTSLQRLPYGNSFVCERLQGSLNNWTRTLGPG